MESPDPAQSKATHLLVCCANALSPGEGYRGPSLREKVSERECPWLRRRVSCCRMSSRVARGFNAGSARGATHHVSDPAAPGPHRSASQTIHQQAVMTFRLKRSSVHPHPPSRRDVPTSRERASYAPRASYTSSCDNDAVVGRRRGGGARAGVAARL